MGPHEIVTEIVVPAPAAGSAGAFLKLSKTSEDIAKVNAAVMIELAGGVCVRAGIAVGSAAPTPVRALAAEQALIGRPVGAQAIADAADAAAGSRVSHLRRPFHGVVPQGDGAGAGERRAREGGRASGGGEGGVMAKEIATFLVNGQEHEVIIEPHMLLIDVLRDTLGLTGTKYACGAGDCGACTVLIDGRPSFSCLTLAVTAKGKSILTIEGVANGNDLHPIQQAFVDQGAVQCGFCTPGMILSTKALLDENPEPTRDEIKSALAGNLCRCTGLREDRRRGRSGGGGDEERGWTMTAEVSSDGTYSSVGKRLARPDVAAKATGAALYGADITLPGMLIGRILMSPHAHARVAKIDISKAKALPGVVAVITHDDVPKRGFTRSVMAEGLPPFAYEGENQDQFILSDKARYIGDWIAAVAAVDVYTAERALDLIEVEYEVLPAVFDPEEALEAGAPVVHDGWKDNVAAVIDHPFNRGDLDAGMEASAHVVEFSGRNSRQKQAHMEPDVAIAAWDAKGRLTVWSPCQNAHLAKKAMGCRVFDIGEGNVRWITPAVGGGFGARLSFGVEPVAAMLAKVAGKPVKVVVTREEDFNGWNSRTEQRQTIRMGVAEDGTINAIEQNVLSDAGAYFSHSGTISAVNMQSTLGRAAVAGGARQGDHGLHEQPHLQRHAGLRQSGGFVHPAAGGRHGSREVRDGPGGVPPEERQGGGRAQHVGAAEPYQLRSSRLHTSGGRKPSAGRTSGRAGESRSKAATAAAWGCPS